MKAAAHPHEPARLAALHSYSVLDTPTEADYDEVTRLASRLCDAPISVINLIDHDRQWFKSEVGLGVRETPLETSICAHAILQDDFVHIRDMWEDARFCDNPLCIGEPHLRFYAGALLKSPDGFPLGTLCILDHVPRDLSELQRSALRTLANQVMAQLELRRALSEQRRLAEQIALEGKRKDDFLAMLAHELRSPLSPLVNAHRLLDRDAALSTQSRGLVAMATRQTRQLQRLVDDLLEVSRIGQGKIELRTETVLLSTIVDRAVETVSPMIEQCRHALTVTLPDRPVRLLADPVRLAQVVENLLTNACKYTPAGGRVRVIATERDGAIEIRVADDGIGIEPAAVAGLFRMFHQIDSSLDRAQGGLGIGLALVRQLVALHGGTVDGASDGLGKGSTFTVRLPRDPSAS